MVKTISKKQWMIDYAVKNIYSKKKGGKKK